jgi:hypothetical protein
VQVFTTPVIDSSTFKRIQDELILSGTKMAATLRCTNNTNLKKIAKHIEGVLVKLVPGISCFSH